MTKKYIFYNEIIFSNVSQTKYFVCSRIRLSSAVSNYNRQLCSPNTEVIEFIK